MKTVEIKCGTYNSLATVKVPNEAKYLYIFAGEIVSFQTLEHIKGEFEEFGMEELFIEIEKLNPGQSWSLDGENIYVRIS